MPKVTLIRHGQSEWNKANKFTGWVDVDLSEKGVKEAIYAGESLKQASIPVDIAFTSYLRRAIKTLWHVLDKNSLCWLNTIKSWRLNERHYGDLQGLDKAETKKKYGEDQVHIWRRSYSTPPPKLNESFEWNIDERYRGLSSLPEGESLKMTYERVVPYWQMSILPKIKDNKNVLIVAHGNSLRALIKHIENISDDEITSLEIPTGEPIIYDLSSDGSFKSKEILQKKR